MREFRDSERASTVSSSRWAESISGSWPTWPIVQKKLDDIGITAAAFEANKNLIFSWFTSVTADRTLKSGDHNDRPKRLPLTMSSNRSVDDLETYGISQSNSSKFAPLQRFRSEDKTSLCISSQQPQVFGYLSPDTTNKSCFTPNSKIHGQHIRSKSVEPRLSARPDHALENHSSVGPLFAPRKRLLEAVEEGNWWNVSEIVDDEFELVLIDQLTLDMALRIAAMRRNCAIARILVDKGADAYIKIRKGLVHSTLLWKKEMRRSFNFSSTKEPTSITRIDM